MKEQDALYDTSLNRQAFGLVIGLCLQYVLGITTTLFVQFPPHLPAGKVWEFAWKQIPLALHIILGLFLLIGSVTLLIQAIKLHSQQWIVAATIGLLIMLLTSLSGSVFVDQQSEISSYSMAIGFIITLFAYIWGIYASKTIAIA